MTTNASTTQHHDADERLRLEFNDWAKAGRGEGMEKGHRPAGEQAIALMNISPGARVLDVGCGSGWATRLLTEQAAQVSAVGIDISDGMVKLAQVSTSADNATFRVATAEKLPFADGEFSDAFSMESLYYYQDMLSALREIKRVLRPGGQFVSVMDLYQENEPSHQWVSQLKVPVQLSAPRSITNCLNRQALLTSAIDASMIRPLCRRITAAGRLKRATIS